MAFSIAKISWSRANLIRASLWALGAALFFAIYTFGISNNPPGFYLDESALSYNAYLVAKTGAGEFGARWPLFFQVYSGGFTQYSNPTQIYLLAAVFWLVGPGILVARLVAAASMFSACLLMGLLGERLSGKRVIGIIVALLALVTPWLFEVGRLVLETFFYPMAVMLFLWALYLAHRKDQWRWFNSLAIACTLALVTYSYTIGRVLGPLLAFGLISFAVDKKHIFGVLKTWGLFALTLIPLIIFNRNNPGLTTRFYLLSYIKPDSTYGEIFSKFILRFFDDLNPVRMIMKGDINPRHHITGALGSMFLGVFVLAVIGLVVVIVQKRRDPYWRFIVFGLGASVVPGALTVDTFHTLRMIAFPVFLLLLTVPALEWLQAKREIAQSKKKKKAKSVEPEETAIAGWKSLFPDRKRLVLASVLLVLTIAEASYFQWKYYVEGPMRTNAFDAPYKPLYDQAVAQPDRPIYLLDSYWGPGYIHSFWYATLEGRSRSEFIHLDYGKRPPPGAIVMSTEQACNNCEMIRQEGVYLFYRAR